MENPEEHKVVKTKSLPAKELELGAIATLASAKWTVSTWLTLLWLTPAEFATLVVNYKAALTIRNISGGTKKGVVQSMKLINKEIDDAMVYVKGYILEIFKKDRAKSMYATFGIQSKGGHYNLPDDIDGRAAALGTLLGAIRDNGLDDKEYGRAFWDDIKARFDELASQTTSLSSTISVKVGDKKELKKELLLALNSLIKAVQANYPHTWKEELRAWGFQKERY